MPKRDAIRALHGFSVQQIDHILSALAVWVHPVSLHCIWRPQLRDPGDSAGRIHIDGTDLGSLSSDGLAELRRERVGIIFQSFHLLPSLSALNNASLPLQLARAVLELIVNLKRELGTTLVLVTHGLDFTARCDRVLRLHDGQLHETHETQDGREAPTSHQPEASDALPAWPDLARPARQRPAPLDLCRLPGAGRGGRCRARHEPGPEAR